MGRGGAETLDDGGVVGGTVVGQDARGGRGRQAAGADVVLDRDRHACQRLAWVPPANVLLQEQLIIHDIVLFTQKEHSMHFQEIFL